MKLTRVKVLAILFLAGCATSPLGRKQLTLLPEGQMDAMGAQAFQEMKAKQPVETSPAWSQYVRCIVDPILARSGSNIPPDRWEVVVFKDESANAFALPGGKVGVHTGLFTVAKTDGQLAAVLGHEVGHVLARHGNERVSQGFAAQIAAGGISALLAQEGEKRQLLNGLLGLGAQVGVLLPFGRTQESEADSIGQDLMAKAGFDPRESVALWQNMKAKAGGASPPEWLSTHPSSDNRIAELQRRMPEAVALYEKAGVRPSCKRP